MTKSIEEQALEYSNQKDHEDDNDLDYGYGAPLRKGFIDGAKSRDKQLLYVVNEMKQALEYYKSNSMTFKHCQEISPDVEEYCNGEIAKDCLTKADQMLKEMGIK